MDKLKGIVIYRSRTNAYKVRREERQKERERGRERELESRCANFIQVRKSHLSMPFVVKRASM